MKIVQIETVGLSGPYRFLRVFALTDEGQILYIDEPFAEWKTLPPPPGGDEYSHRTERGV